MGQQVMEDFEALVARIRMLRSFGLSKEEIRLRAETTEELFFFAWIGAELLGEDTTIN
jgi:hypothetical protein